MLFTFYLLVKRKSKDLSGLAFIHSISTNKNKFWVYNANQVSVGDNSGW